MGQTVFGQLEKRLNELRESFEGPLTAGSAKDYAAYKYSCGAIHGLDLALREIKTVANAHLEDGDDE